MLPNHAPSSQRLNETPAGFSGRFRRGGRRAWITTVLLGVVGFVALLSLIQEGSALRLIDDARQGILYGYEASNFSKSTTFVVFMYLGAVGVTAIAFLAWLSRTVDNVPALGGGRPSVTPRWSIGWWFIPFANLVKPYKIVRDIHDRMAMRPGSGGGWVVIAWWVLWVLGNVIYGVSTLLPEPKDFDALATFHSIKGTANALTFLSAVLAIAVVLRIQWRADERADELGARATQTAPA